MAISLVQRRVALLIALSVVLQAISITVSPSYIDTQQNIRRLVYVVLAVKGVGAGVGGTPSTIYVDFSVGDTIAKVPVDIDGSKACCIYAVAIVGIYDLQLGKFIVISPYTYKGSASHCDDWLCWRYYTGAQLPINGTYTFEIDTSTCPSTGYAQVIFRNAMVCRVTHCTWWRRFCSSRVVTRDINLSIHIPCNTVL